MAAPFDCLIIAPPAPAESSSEMNPLPYDAFINHHGADTKHGVASSIYNKLDATGLRVFLDKYELKFGTFFPKTLEAAMRSSSVHIAILSENCTQSPWCLAELEFILQLTGIKFIPIFYHVDPSALRWVIKREVIYEEALSTDKMKCRYNSKKLENWKLALHKASFYTGEIFSNQGEEEKAVTNVVNLVLKELKKVRIDVAKLPVGLDEAEQDFNNIALQSAAGPMSIQMVGIWGMGGAGKITFAKHLFNKKHSTIDRSSFLSGVREAARKELLHEKQKKLLEDLDFKGQGAFFDSVDEGKEILRSPPKSVSVLTVLDNVDHTDQLDALLPAWDSLGHGSLIIVTTRELRVLKAWGISAIYKIRALSATHAEELFCWHAFGQPSPLLGFKELPQNFINACHGLPLSLNVFGGLHSGESSKTCWQSQLDKVSRIVPDDIKLRLTISYDALDKEEKEMLLDTVCFFIGRRSSDAIAVWDGSEWNGLHGWQMLVNKLKCLVELDEENNRIRMPDHLRDLKREIANHQSPYRLWSKGQIIEIQPKQVAVRVRGMAYAFGDTYYPWQGHIILNTNEGERTLQPGSIGLKILIGGGDFIDEQHIELSKDLVYLRWRDFQHKNLPSWLSLKKLRILKLLSKRLQGLWERDADAPSALKGLIISDACELEKIENLKSLTSLEERRIYKCPELDGLPGLRESTSLRKIVLIWCHKLQNIEGLESLKSLETLEINDCRELNALPSLAELTFLKTIELSYCNKLEKIEGLKCLTSLEELRICECRQLDGLPGLGELTSLRKIELTRCHKLQKIEGLESLILLETLKINDCRELNALASRAELTFLKTIELRKCNKLEKIEGLKSLRSQEELRIYECPELDGLPALGESTSPRKIVLIWCHKLQNIEGLESLKSLKTLEINDCRELNALPSLAELMFLKTIELRKCNKLEKIACVKSLRLLEGLKIYVCPELYALPGLAESTSLRKIELVGCHKLQTIEGLESLKSMETLDINDCRELNVLPSLAELTFLKTIELRECHNWKKIEGIGPLRLLETVIAHDSTEFNTLPNLAELTSLKKLELIKCYKLEKIGGLDSLRSLEMPRIEDCPELDTLPSLVKLALLEEFKLDRFEVHACLKAPCRVNLEQRKLIVAANDVSVVESFSSKIQARQREVIIWRAVKNFFTSFPLKNVVEFTSFGGLKLRRPENADDSNAILICFIIGSLYSLYPKLHLNIYTDTGKCFYTELANGKWVWMVVFPQGSDWLQSNRYEIWACSEDKDVKVKEAWLVRSMCWDMKSNGHMTFFIFDSSFDSCICVCRSRCVQTMNELYWLSINKRILDFKSGCRQIC